MYLSPTTCVQLALNYVLVLICSDFKFLQFNFVGRILGPRGNSLKRVEASTGCRVFIRGKGSIKDTEKVTKMLYFFIASHVCACVIYDIFSLERFYSLLGQGASLSYLM
jgi:hypothetical protein